MRFDKLVFIECKFVVQISRQGLQVRALVLQLFTSSVHSARRYKATSLSQDMDSPGFQDVHCG